MKIFSYFLPKNFDLNWDFCFHFFPKSDLVFFSRPLVEINHLMYLEQQLFSNKMAFFVTTYFFTGDIAVSPCQSLMRSDPFPKHRLPVSKFSSFKVITSCLAFFHSNRAAIYFKVRGCQIQKLKPSSQMPFPAKSCKIRVPFCHLCMNKGDVLDCLRIVITL